MFSFAPDKVCVISKETKIKGNIQFESPCIIYGEVEGDVESNKSIIIETNGFFKGVIKCPEIYIRGKIKGEIECGNILIYDKGTAEGDIWCDSIEIHEGGQFIGIRHEKKKEKENTT